MSTKGKAVTVITFFSAGLLLVGCSSGASSSETSTQSAFSTTMATDRGKLEMFVAPVGTFSNMVDRSDVVVLAHLNENPREVLEGSLNGPGGESSDIPMLVYPVSIDKVLHGSAPAHLSIARYDWRQLSIDAEGTTPTGVPIILFLHRGPKDVYAVVGMDQGLVDIADDESLKWRVINPSDFPSTVGTLEEALAAS